MPTRLPPARLTLAVPGPPALTCPHAISAPCFPAGGGDEPSPGSRGSACRSACQSRASTCASAACAGGAGCGERTQPSGSRAGAPPLRVVFPGHSRPVRAWTGAPVPGPTCPRQEQEGASTRQGPALEALAPSSLPVPHPGCSLRRGSRFCPLPRPRWVTAGGRCSAAPDRLCSHSRAIRFSLGQRPEGHS